MRQYQYLIAPILGWLVAQSLKYAITLRKEGLKWGDVVESGGMPSSHSALMVALATVVGINAGVASVAFGVAASLTGIVIYDAMGVRRTTGQQTVAIKELAKAGKHELKTEIALARGHTPAEVIVGSIVGFLVGLLVTSVL
jgi:acid phosphatase family membrane protein YuiD